MIIYDGSCPQGPASRSMTYLCTHFFLDCLDENVHCNLGLVKAKQGSQQPQLMSNSLRMHNSLMTHE